MSLVGRVLGALTPGQRRRAVGRRSVFERSALGIHGSSPNWSLTRQRKHAKKRKARNRMARLSRRANRA